MVLNRAPLELAGRVALAGKLPFERDPSARVVWGDHDPHDLFR